MAYGTVKVDNITFTNGGIDQTVTVSGIVQSISGNITATGTIQAATIIGTSTVSGATVTGNAGVFTTVTGGSAGFTTVTGTTVTGTTANFATISGTTITGGAVTVASGTFSGNSTAAAFIPTGSTVPTNGVYLPAANSVALSTSGVGRVFVDASGNVGAGAATPAHKLSIEGTTYANSSLSLTRFTTTAGSGQELIFRKSNSDTQGTNTAVGPNTKLGGILFSGANGTTYQAGFGIASFTTSDWSTGTYLSALTFTDNASASERARIDSSGRLLVGTSSARTNFYGSGGNPSTFQVDTFASITRSTNDSFASILAIAKSRGAGNVAVQDGDSVGVVTFQANDGSNFIQAAEIRADVDGTPGANDMPGRLVFSVTADGSASPSEAMRINNAGELLVGYTSDNGAYKLQVNSQIFATSAIIATSDGRYKENVAELNGCVDLVKALRPVSFDWKVQDPVTRVDEDGETVVVREAHNFPDGKQIGFIAQEVEEVLADKPWLGSVIKQNVRPAITDADGNELAPEEEFLGIAEGNLVAVLTSALKDAIGRIESLEAEVAALKA